MVELQQGCGLAAIGRQPPFEPGGRLAEPGGDGLDVEVIG
jgi:hypothetical protein